VRKGQQLKRLVRAAVVSAALGSTLLVSGCGTSDVAAVVDGHVITEAQVADVTREINEAFKPQAPFAPQQALNFLIHSRAVLDYAAENGFPQSESAARAEIPMSNPSPATIDVLRTNAAYGKVTQADEVPLSQKIQALKVEVNPKYGTYDSQTGALGPSTPDWLKFSAANPAQ